ncbi:MAG: GTP-dependent dephospho-CoA kinase family protein, partial [Candidatus Heimdallarchaeaceae archaeon]
ILSVGDIATQTLLSNSVNPDLAVIDDKVQRKKIKPLEFTGFEIRNAPNPAGSITMEAWNEIRKALKNDENKIVIKISGEEDLLVFPVILEAPYNSKVLYGQPNEGLVVVTITKEMKIKANKLMLRMVKANEN